MCENEATTSTTGDKHGDQTTEVPQLGSPGLPPGVTGRDLALDRGEDTTDERVLDDDPYERMFEQARNQESS